MLSRGTFLILSAAAFMCLMLRPSASQAQSGSIYFSVGDNKAWYSPSTIHVSQSQLGNGYDLVHVKADNKTKTAISPFQLNYRLGYYCNYEQTLGIEFNYDPVNYHVTDGQTVALTGMVNSIPQVNKKIVFSAKNGYSYKYDGANLMLLNVVRRIQIYRTNNKRIGADLILKGGVGPVMPHVQNSLPVDAVDNPQLEWGGWNVAGEAGVRVTIYRYGFLEFAGKYDYASFSGINTYQGTASQQLSTYEAIASVGIIIPTTKHNPLFYKQTVVTIIPIFVDKKDKEDKQAASDSALTEDIQPLTDVPEFSEIVERDEKHKYRDSMAAVIRNYYDSATANERRKDSIMTREMNDSLNTPAKPSANDTATGSKAGTINVDSLENKLMQQGNAAPAPPVVQPVMTKKEKKKLEKLQKKDKKKLEEQQELDKKNKEAEEKAAKDKAGDATKTENNDKKEQPEDKKETPPPADQDKKDAPPDTPPAGNTDKKGE